jgi:hypothetical protein
MGSLVQLDLFPDNEQLSFNFEQTMQKLGPSFTVTTNNLTAATEEEAITISNEYVKETT